MTGTEKAERAKLTEEREIALVQVCLTCRENDKACRGECELYKQARKTINTEFNLKFNELKLKYKRKDGKDEKRKKVDLQRVNTYV
jgi:hypothetical protein